MRTSWNVGLATCAIDPAPWATPRTNVVLPAPSSPVSSTTSPCRSLSPSSIPARSVSAGELVTSSGKVVVAAALKVRADHPHVLLRGQLADDLEPCLGDGAIRAHADKLFLLPSRHRLDLHPSPPPRFPYLTRP